MGSQIHNKRGLCTSINTEASSWIKWWLNNNSYIYSAILIIHLHKAGAVLNIFHEIIPLIFLTALWGRNYSNSVAKDTGPDRPNNLVEVTQLGRREARIPTSQAGYTARGSAATPPSLTRVPLSLTQVSMEGSRLPGLIFKSSKEPQLKLHHSSSLPTSTLQSFFFPVIWGKVFVLYYH